MPPKDFHQKFDKSTQTKLHIFNEYFKESFPVFLYTPYWEEILIFDFFAGKGYDETGEKSTSLNILEQVKPYCNDLISKNKKLHIFLNDKDCKAELEQNVMEYLVNCKKDCKNECVIERGLHITANDFATYFDEIYEKLKRKPKAAKLIFLDPFNFILDQVKFAKLISLKATDFICFLPSSYLYRFREYKGFNAFINTKELPFDNTPAAHSHRVIADYFASLIPESKEYYIGCFSIKKGSNYYGLIFGSNHTLGAEKFQRVCWDLDNLTGEADYDIDREISYNKTTGFLFEELKISKKVQDFKHVLVEKIYCQDVETDIDAYKFALRNRCLVKHASEVLRDLSETKKIDRIKTITADIHRHQPINIKLL